MIAMTHSPEPAAEGVLIPRPQRVGVGPHERWKEDGQ